MLQKKPVQIIANEEGGAFAQDAYDLFAQRRGGHISRWLYSSAQYDGDKACGAEAWRKAIIAAKNGSPYYVFLKERETIQSFASGHERFYKSGCRIIDLGPGSADAVQHKVAPLITAVSGNIEAYVAVDVCGETLDIACKTIKSEFPLLHTTTLQRDFVQDSFSYGERCGQEISMLFGLTLCNMAVDPRVENLPEYYLTAYFKRLKSHLTALDAYLFITQDTNQNERILKDAYFALEEHYMSFLYRIQRDLDVTGDYDPVNFKMDVQYLAATQACAISVVAIKDMIFSINGNIVSIKRGERFYFHNAFKFNEETFLAAAKNAGFECEYTKRIEGNPCLLHVLKAH